MQFTNECFSLQSLPFEKVKHAVSTLDAQPSGEAGGILILVTGALLVCCNAGVLSRRIN
jgi:hypothetical protein